MLFSSGARSFTVNGARPGTSMLAQQAKQLRKLKKIIRFIVVYYLYKKIKK